MADTSVAEQWRPIPSTDGVYEASSHGRVRRSTQVYSCWVTLPPGREPTRCLETNGYFRCHVKMPNGRTKKIGIHNLVAEAFFGPRPRGLYVNHKDGNKQNNHSENLEYVTPKENAQHASANGLLPCGDGHWTRRTPEKVVLSYGENHGQSKLTESQVLEIRYLYQRGGITQKALGKKYGVHGSAVSNIVNRKNWVHV